jgi:hypothetical protein
VPPRAELHRGEKRGREREKGREEKRRKKVGKEKRRNRRKKRKGKETERKKEINYLFVENIISKLYCLLLFDKEIKSDNYIN